MSLIQEFMPRGVTTRSRQAEKATSRGSKNRKNRIGMFGLELWQAQNAYRHGDPRREALRALAGLTDAELAGVESGLPEGF